MVENGTPPLKNLDIGPDGLGEVHLWADWVELRCLVHADGELTVADVAAMAKADETDAVDAYRALAAVQDADGRPGGDDDAADDDDDRAEEDAAEEEEDTDDVPARTRRPLRPRRPVDGAHRVDKRAVLAADVFRVLSRRLKDHGEDYPFLIAGQGRSAILTVRGDLRERHRTYVYLLLCSGQRWIARDKHLLTQSFERLTAVVLRRMFPFGETHIFGTTASPGDLFSGKLKDRVHALADLLNEQPGPDVDLLPDENSGDNGADAIVVINLGDHLKGVPTVFAQAACTDEWKTKQDSVKPDSWHGTLSLTVPQLPVCAIPFSFRDSTGNWHDYARIRRTVILDRLRIMHLLKGDGTEEKARLEDAQLPYGLVEDVLSHKVFA